MEENQEISGAQWLPTDTNHHITVLLQPEEKKILVPREKAKNVGRLLEYLKLRPCTALVARDGVPLTHDAPLYTGQEVLVRKVMSSG